MRKRDTLALAMPPLLLRIMLGAVFLWAGLGKVMSTDTVDANSAAVLANLGVVKPGAAAPADPNTPATPLPTTQPSHTPGEKSPSASPPDSAPPSTPPSTPPSAPPSPPAGEKPESKPTGGGSVRAGESLSGFNNEPRFVLASFQHDSASGGTTSQPSGAANTGPIVYTAKDFPNGATTRRVNMLALGIYTAANPAPNADGSTAKAIWPKALGNGRKPVYLGWAVTLTEVAAGAFVLVGLLTRLSSFGIICIMLGAMWLTQIGPAIASGKNHLGFLPPHSAFSHEWMTFMVQFILLFAAAALMFAGPGLLALDNAFFSRPKKHDDHDGE